MKKFLGIICILYSGLIGYVWIFDKLKNFLAPNMQLYLKLSLPILLIMGIMLLKEKNDKFKISNLILLLPIVMIVLSSDGKLTNAIAINRSTKPKIKKQIKKVEVKEEKEEEDDDIEIDKDNLEIHFDVIDKNYMDLATYITFPFENYKQYQNKTIRVKGLALKNIDNTPKGYVQLGRYAITCCAADASFAGFYVKEEGNNIKDNTWYEVEGILKKSVYDYVNIMYIKVINIKEIDKNGNEDYVYPCYSYDDGSCQDFLKYNLKY